MGYLWNKTVLVGFSVSIFTRVMFVQEMQMTLLQTQAVITILQTVLTHTTLGTCHHNGECGCGHHHHHHGHDADEVFSNFGVETAKKFTREELENALSKLSGEEYGTVLRAKGIVAGADGVWYHFDFVPEEYEVRTGSADVTGRMCVIGAKLAEDKIKALFGV